MKCVLCISNFFEEISSLSRSIVFHYFFAMILRKAFLTLLAILGNSEFECIYLSFFTLPFTSLLFTAICKVSSDSHFAFLDFFSLEMVLIRASCTVSWTSVHSSSGTLFVLFNVSKVFPYQTSLVLGLIWLCFSPLMSTTVLSMDMVTEILSLFLVTPTLWWLLTDIQINISRRTEGTERRLDKNNIWWKNNTSNKAEFSHFVLKCLPNNQMI